MHEITEQAQFHKSCTITIHRVYNPYSLPKDILPEYVIYLLLPVFYYLLYFIIFA
jgi:hypothetical protein